MGCDPALARRRPSSDRGSERLARHSGGARTADHSAADGPERVSKVRAHAPPNARLGAGVLVGRLRPRGRKQVLGWLQYWAGHISDLRPWCQYRAAVAELSSAGLLPV